MSKRTMPYAQRAGRNTKIVTGVESRGPDSRWTGDGMIQPGAGARNTPEAIGAEFIQKVGDGLKEGSRRFSRLGRMPKNPLHKP